MASLAAALATAVAAAALAAAITSAALASSTIATAIVTSPAVAAIVTLQLPTRAAQWRRERAVAKDGHLHQVRPLLRRRSQRVPAR